MKRDPQKLAPLRFSGAIMALAAACLVTSPASARKPAPPPPASAPAPALAPLDAELLRPGNADLRQFYYYRGNRPLWTADGRIAPAADTLLALIDSAELDGIASAQVRADALHRAIDQARTAPSPATLGQAELALSRSLAAYARLTLDAPREGMIYEHATLQPQAPPVAGVLTEAAKAPSLDRWIADMAWLHPLYAQVRKAYVAGGSSPSMRQVVTTNLQRIRAIPAAPPGGRYVLVNAAAARLWMYDHGKPVDTMKVVVGKVDHQTPMMSGYIRYAILNPYWNVPADFTRDKIAGQVMKQGAAYLKRGGYQVLSDWTPEARVISPAEVDWRAVADGSVDLRVRQLPGAANSMGKVKFEFPNPLGIYLHDTPQTDLMTKDARQFSSGCVRLEDAQRLGRWLFEGGMPGASQTEQRFDLPQVVPVYITYLTVQPGADGQLAMLDDPYSRDPQSRNRMAGNLR
jgi:murein L,D-transpeptidase YcbB/YkuD